MEIAESDGKVGVHQCFVLSSLLFVIVLEGLISGKREGLLWELLYAVNLVLITDSMEIYYLKNSWAEEFFWSVVYSRITWINQRSQRVMKIIALLKIVVGGLDNLSSKPLHYNLQRMNYKSCGLLYTAGWWQTNATSSV